MASILEKKQKKKEKYTLKELKTLGHQLLSSREHINNLPLLLSFISSSSPPQHALESLLSLSSFFTPLLPQVCSSAKYSLSSSKDDPEFIYRTWLKSKFDDFVNSLIHVSLSPQSEDTLRDIVLDTIMEFVKTANAGNFHSAIYHRFLHGIVYSEHPVHMLLDLLASNYFTYISMEKLAGTLEAKEISESSIEKLHHILSHIPSFEDADKKDDAEMWSMLEFSFGKKEDLQKESMQSEAEVKKNKKEKSKKNMLNAKKMKLKFTKAWISFLRLPLPIDVYKEVLVTLHQAVIPHLSNPIIDFLTRSYDIGGVISVMALSSLFILMTQYGLEYPNFYEKLYALLVPSIFMAKHRAKFFELLDSCLKSPLLPAYLAAAFTKKLSRLALSVPPSGALIIIALIHNLLRRHPSINHLVHQEYGCAATEDDTKEERKLVGDEDEADCSGISTSSNKPGFDHFNNEETDPVKTKAMKSSLWEIDTLRHHYCPPVSRFVLSLENDLKVEAEVAVKDFSSASYATIFRDEIGRRVKQVPLAFYKATPTSLFSESDFPGWTFKCEDISEEHNHNSTKRQRMECS
ncbi:CCAAT-binding factor [Dillenia turbinata]|uniref:CCAAT-binding factor n=1 Tax=Dillenia turbinata TaxID=194707 RepID=A0AAN8V5A8_9MAGN